MLNVDVMVYLIYSKNLMIAQTTSVKIYTESGSLIKIIVSDGIPVDQAIQLSSCDSSICAKQM